MLHYKKEIIHLKNNPVVQAVFTFIFVTSVTLVMSLVIASYFLFFIPIYLLCCIGIIDIILRRHTEKGLPQLTSKHIFYLKKTQTALILITVFVFVSLLTGCSSTKPPTSPCAEYAKIKIDQYQEATNNNDKETFVYNEFGNRITTC